VEQALNNLVVNAQDELPQGGRIVVSTRLVVEPEARRALLPVRPGRYVVFEVCDNGLGLDAEALQFAVHPTQSAPSDSPASGLGLTVVLGLMREHHGYVDVESSPGVGTRVFLGFPVEGEEEDEALPIIEGHIGTEVVLVVEDDPGVRAVIERILTAHRYRPVCTLDGEDALRQFDEDPFRFDVAVVDILMPRIGGIELYHELARIRPGFRVLWVSGYAEGQQVLVGPDTDFLAKPFRPIDLVRRLRGLLDRAPT
jgi:CheY-like chemotaxis protein